MSKCTGIAGRIYGHHMQAVYDSEPIVVQEAMKIKDMMGNQNISEVKIEYKKTYIQSVCRRCGEVIVNTNVLNL